MSKSALVDQTFTRLSQNLSRLYLLTTLLTDGRGRESLTGEQADELDWWMGSLIADAEVVVSELQDAVQNMEEDAQ